MSEAEVGHAWVNTKAAERRRLSFADVSELVAELDAIERSHADGTLRTTGNWTAAQGLEHLARTWKAALDGFPEGANPPFVVKLVVKMLFRKKAVSGQTAPAGMRPPKLITDALEAAPDTSFDDAMSHLRGQIARTETGGERFTVASPLFGEMTHEEWSKLQLGHAQLHLGFLHPG